MAANLKLPGVSAWRDASTTILHLGLATPKLPDAELSGCEDEDRFSCNEPAATQRKERGPPPMLPAAILRGGRGIPSSEAAAAAAARAVAAAAEVHRELAEESPTDDSDLTGLPSVGSALHATGSCQPCGWFWKPGGCQNGRDCQRCHLCPEGELKNRKKTKHTLFRLGLATPKVASTATIKASEPRHVQFKGSTEFEVVEVTPVAAFSSSEGGEPCDELTPSASKEPKTASWSPGMFTSVCDAGDKAAIKPILKLSRLQEVARESERTTSTMLPTLSDAGDVFGSTSIIVAPEGDVTGRHGDATGRHGDSTGRHGDVTGSISFSFGTDDQMDNNSLEFPPGDSTLRHGDVTGSICFSFGTDDQMDNNSLEFPPGLGPQGGSQLHGSGMCQPCAWFWKPDGCKAGSECDYCHLCPEGELKARKKQKHTLMRLGLVTPKASSEAVRNVTFGGKESAPVDLQESDQESTPGAGSDSKARKKQKQTMMRLGLVTPKASETSRNMSFGGEEGARVGHQESDQESTTAAGSGLEEAGSASEADAGAGKQAPGARNAEGALLPVPPGLVPPPETPSHGSTLHRTGTCQPCAWFWKSGGCQNGVQCSYCHLCPESELKERKKSKHAQMRLGLVTPKLKRKEASGSQLSADAPEFMPGFHMPIADRIGLATPKAPCYGPFDWEAPDFLNMFGMSPDCEEVAEA